MASESYPSYFIFLGVILMVATIAQCEDYGLEDNVKELLARRKNLDYVRQLVEDMGNQLNKLHKRACILRIPGVECELGDLIGAQSYWNDSPGKNRRSQYSCEFKVGNPEGCLGKMVEDDKKDNSHWGNPDGPGKK
ncbi:uncharacterized protein [Parasteatoda tepidariorum]|uniref:uncharacterized protein n=1 Tax=Parasteatoda tepidariorum TaxID=114398 RepID=UPI00077FC81A|nr:uncharacterized protein LOC107436961 isoform X1 [Parasteatoda tepidariorum]